MTRAVCLAVGRDWMLLSSREPLPLRHAVGVTFTSAAAGGEATVEGVVRSVGSGPAAVLLVVRVVGLAPTAREPLALHCLESRTVH